MRATGIATEAGQGKRLPPLEQERRGTISALPSSLQIGEVSALAGLFCANLETQQTSGILTEDGGAIFLGDRQSPDAIKHEAKASDLMGIIAAGKEMAGPGELKRML